MTRYFVCLLGFILAVPLLVLTALTIKLPITISGIGYLVACWLVIFGLILAPWVAKYYLYPIAAGMLVIGFIVSARIVLGKQQSAITMTVLPVGKGASWLSYIIAEQDNVIFGEALFHMIGGTSAQEHENITQALHAEYSRMKGVVPSPVLGTYLNLQQPAAFDAIVLEPEANRHTDIGVIFLHGFMGNVTVQCWEIAEAVSRFGAVTVCPSTEWQGKWWKSQGEEIFRSTFGYLRERGIQKIYLGGFSNGGFGISCLVPKLGSESGLSGLIFIDGIGNGSDIREMGLPVLVIQGTQDERMPVSEAHRIADMLGNLATYVEVDSDHFVIMKQPEAVQNALAAWLESQNK